MIVSCIAVKPSYYTFELMIDICFVTTDISYVTVDRSGPQCNRRDPTAPHVLEAGPAGTDAAATPPRHR